FKHVEFNEPYDGVVYSVAVSIGFATLENLGYLFFHSSQPAMILLRGLLPVSGHALFAIMMGYFLGKAKFSCIHYKKIFLFLSWIIPMIAHATYNFILEQKMMDWVYLMLPFLTFLWWYGLKKIKIATKLSPFHESEPPEVNY
ncbi:PrsW family glutamic-type intramembrane protease, partial [Tepidibacillus decaturensis]|uniref:PrsW family glutamic-type intramembrane protease n=2 Tax=Bacillaceae TaxID=186817 RepID=UPI00137B4E05